MKTKPSPKSKAPKALLITPENSTPDAITNFSCWADKIGIVKKNGKVIMPRSIATTLGNKLAFWPDRKLANGSWVYRQTRSEITITIS